MTELEKADLACVVAGLVRLAPRIAPLLRGDPATPPTGEAAAWRNIADGCEIIADSARFLAERAGVMRSPRQG